MGEFERQHFVPKLLQRFFSTDGQSIWCYSLSTKDCIQSSIRKTVQKSWYYKFDDKEKTVLEHWLGEMEDDVAPVLGRLVNDKDYQLTGDEYELCFGFALVQLMRTPKAIQAMKHVYEFCKQRLIPAVMEEVNKGVRTDKNIPFQTVIGVRSVLDSWPGTSMLVIRNETDEELIMSDNPACLFSPIHAFAEKADLTHLLIKQPSFSGNMLYLPISPSCGLLLFDDRYYKFTSKGTYCLQAEDVHTLNSLEVRNATNLLLFKEGAFNADAYLEDFEFRKTGEFAVKQKTVYTPVDDSFCLSALNCDKGFWKYLICSEAAKNAEATFPKIEGLI